MQDELVFDEETFGEFKTVYATAKLKGLPGFSFQDNYLDIDYAKYVIEYLESQFKEGQ